MIHAFLFAPTPLCDALIGLCEQMTGAPPPLTAVGFNLSDGEGDLYRALDAALSAVPPEDCALVLGDLLGGTSATIALSMPHAHVNFLGGVSLPMLLALKEALAASRPLGGVAVSATDQLARCAELLKVAARGGAMDSQSYLRATGEDSNIDASYFEGDASVGGGLGGA
jgi:mannose/fructose-specific phosphotransferase system component IIA